MSFDCRSALYMPASNARVLAKGPVSRADAVIVDLEDSVAPDSKFMARKQAVQVLSEADYGFRVKALRINAAETPWYKDDISAVMKALPDAVVLPKVESATDIASLSDVLDTNSKAADVAIWAMMESTTAIVNASAIAACKNEHPRLSVFLIGNNDLARSSNMPISSDRTYLLPWLMSLVAAAKSHDIGILDGVYNDFRDLAGFTTECAQGVAMGMDGKTLIHPSQVEIANDVFAPSAADIAQARAVVAAFADPANTGAGVLQIDGRMIERLHLSMAESTLARLEKLASRT